MAMSIEVKQQRAAERKIKRQAAKQVWQQMMRATLRQSSKQAQAKQERDAFGHAFYHVEFKSAEDHHWFKGCTSTDGRANLWQIQDDIKAGLERLGFEVRSIYYNLD